jgi:hypothetical protein
MPLWGCTSRLVNYIFLEIGKLVLFLSHCIYKQCVEVLVLHDYSDPFFLFLIGEDFGLIHHPLFVSYKFLKGKSF